MHIYTEEENGPTVTLELPLEIVRTLREVLYRHISPSMGIDQALYDEIGYQVQAQTQPVEDPAASKVVFSVTTSKPLTASGKSDVEVLALDNESSKVLLCVTVTSAQWWDILTGKVVVVENRVKP
jgi:hypothetical protein